MKVSYEERLAIDFGLRRRCDEGNNVVLSVRAGGNAGQLLSSEIITFACRPGPFCGKAISLEPLLARLEGTRRSPRTCACVEIQNARTGRSDRLQVQSQIWLTAWTDREPSSGKA